MEDLSIDSRKDDGAVVLNCRGKLTLGQPTQRLRQAVRQAVGEDVPKIILNLGGVTYIDSAGIGELVSCFSHVWNQGGKLVLADLTTEIHDLLVMTGLVRAFEIFDGKSPDRTI